MANNSQLTVLYIGSLSPKSNSLRRYATLKQYLQVTGIDIDLFVYKSVFRSVHHHLNKGLGIYSLNREIRHRIRNSVFDLIWVDNRPFLTRQTLEYIRKTTSAAKIINVLTDDPYGAYQSGWQLLRRTCSFYDFHFVQRQVNISELKACGANEVQLCYRSFDPGLHQPVRLTDTEMDQYAAPVGFIGTYEDVRAEFIAYLIQNGIPVKIVGDGWENSKYWDIIKPHFRGSSVYGMEYIKYLNGFKIVLHFLRHANRDEQDSRTFEIPACKAFMLAERSNVHKSLFTEDVEAVFFTSKQELLQKVKLYMINEHARKTIAEAGYKAALTKGYDHKSRMNHILETVFHIQK